MPISVHDSLGEGCTTKAIPNKLDCIRGEIFEKSSKSCLIVTKSHDAAFTTFVGDCEQTVFDASILAVDALFKHRH